MALDTKMIAKWVNQMNKKHAVVVESGKTVIFNEEFDHELERNIITRSTFADFERRYAGKFVKVGTKENGDDDRRKLTDLWMNDGRHRHYDSVIFAPGKDIKDAYNLWQGFAFKPKAGCWELLRLHLLEVICQRDVSLFNWLLGWMAHAVQHPGRPAETAVALRGIQGSGKSITGRLFGKLFGRHFVRVCNPKHLTGNFNAHLHQCVVLLADEVFGSNNRTAEGTLLTLISEEEIQIERKGFDTRSAKNCVHLIMTSNSDWMVPAHHTDRRFAIFDLADTHAEDHPYFEAMEAEMVAGGYEAMLYDLKQLDFSTVNVRKAPKTEALREQKIASLSPGERWWYDRLMTGSILRDHSTWQTVIPREDLHEEYGKALGGSRKKESTTTELGMLLHRLVPGLSDTRRKMPPIGGSRKRCWQFPSLDDCREAFDHYTQDKHPWLTS